MTSILAILNNIRPEANFLSSDNFIEDGLLDSFDMVTLVTELDKAYSVSIDGIDIIPENFRNIDSIKTLLLKKGVSL